MRTLSPVSLWSTRGLYLPDKQIPMCPLFTKQVLTLSRGLPTQISEWSKKPNFWHLTRAPLSLSVTRKKRNTCFKLRTTMVRTSSKYCKRRSRETMRLSLARTTKIWTSMFTLRLSSLRGMIRKKPFLDQKLRWRSHFPIRGSNLEIIMAATSRF